MGAELSAHDSAIWRTIWINDLIDSGAFHTVPVTPTTFAPFLGNSERVVASGPYSLYDFTAAGDGSYIHKSGGTFFYSSNPGLMAAGLAGMALGAAFRSAGNKSRRREAELHAQQQWRPIEAGVIHVSQHGFYKHSAYGLGSWGWQPILSAELIAPGQMVFAGNSDRGPIQWILDSDWAELIFTLWARVRHPDHVQFRGGTWVPPGWVERAQASQYGLPRLTSGQWQNLLPGPERS